MIAVVETGEGDRWLAGRRHRPRPGPADIEAQHVPVLLGPMLEALAVRPDATYLDGTFGGGGYSRAILAAGAGRLLGLDRDPDAVARGRRLESEHATFTMIEGRFGDMEQLLGDRGVLQLDGVVLDLGLSSQQLADPTRGFSFALDGPLDMRMSGRGPGAAEIVARADQATLAQIIARHGEEPAARRIARAIVEQRVRMPIESTRALADLVARAVGRRPGRTHPATRTFQALRIHVNDELDELARALEAAERLLAPGGRLVVVAFHSLEDRLVKRFLEARSGAQARPSRHRPLPEEAPPAPRFRRLHRGAIKPDAAEVAANPRARSARLRAAVRLPVEERPR